MSDLQLHNLTSSKGTAKKKKRVGRGLASRGTYSGRGMKGQRSRAGSSGLVALGMKRTIESIPKLRGFKSIHPDAVAVSLSSLEQTFDAKTIVTHKALRNAGLIPAAARHAKILGTGEIKKALNIKGVPASKVAKEKIEKAGGSVA